MLTIGIVVTLNQYDYIEACINSCLASDLASKDLLRIIIVDNASHPNVQRLLLGFSTTYKSIITLIPNDVNVGYATACNQIINNCHTEFLALIHSDIIIPYCFPGILFSQLETSKNCFICPLTNYANEHLVCLPSLRSHFERIKPSNKSVYSAQALASTLNTLYSGSLNKFALYNFTNHKDSNPVSLKESSSHCIAGRLDLFHKTAGFDERFTTRGFEDKEFFLRTRRMGIEWKLYSQLYVHHHGNLSTDGIGNNFQLVMKKQEEIFNQIKKETFKPISSALGDSNESNTDSKELILNNHIPLLDASQIVHVVNFSNFSETSRLYKAQRLLVESIEKGSLGYNVKKIGCVRQDLEIEGFEIVKLERDASNTFSNAKDYPYLKDMLDIGCRYAEENDWIVFCNTDCVISPEFYKNLLGYSQSKFVQYTRMDVYNNPTTLQQVYNYPNRHYNVGIDGFAIKKNLYLQVKEQLPDFLIGQPHWDSFYSAFFRTLNLLSQNYTDLYHCAHPIAWNDCESSQLVDYQRQLLELSGVSKLENNLFADIIKENKDTAVVVYFNNPTEAELQAFSTLVEGQRFPGDYIIVELFKDKKTESLLRIPNSQYIGIKVTDLYDGIDNKFECYNYVLTNKDIVSRYNYFIFVDSFAYSLQSNWLAKLRLEIIEKRGIVFGFSKIIDSTNQQYLNYAYACQTWQRDKGYVVGKVFGFSKIDCKNFRFNSRNIFNCGDDLLTTRIIGNIEDFTHIYTNNRFDKQKIDIGYDVLDMSIWTAEKINNVTKNQKISTLSVVSSIDDYISCDSYGLTRWAARGYREAFKEIEHVSDLNVLVDYFDPLINTKNRDFAVVIPTYGRQRIHLTKTVIERLLQQDLKPQIILVELLFDNLPSDFNLPSITHLVLRGDTKHKDLCQKEALLNIGAKAIDPNIKYLFFLDNDVYSTDRKWLYKIRELLIKDKENIVQGFSKVVDSLDPNYQFFSLIYAKQNNLATAKSNPGICWGMTVEKFKQIQGFNNLFLEYSGDSGFVVETLNTNEITYENCLTEYQCFIPILRFDLPKSKATYVDVLLVHLNHGFFKDRSYNVRKYIIDSWTKPITTAIGLDENGLVYWKEDDCIERKSLQNIPSNDNHDAVDRFFAQHDYKTNENRNQQQYKTYSIATEGVEVNEPRALPCKYLIPEISFNFPYYSSTCWSKDIKNSVYFKPPLDKDQQAIVLEPLNDKCIFSIPLLQDSSITSLCFVDRKKLVLDISGVTTLFLQFQIAEQFSRKVAMVIEKRENVKISLKEFCTNEFDFSKVQTLVLTCEKCDKLLIHRITIE